MMEDTEGVRTRAGRGRSIFDGLTAIANLTRCRPLGPRIEKGRLRASREDLFEALSTEQFTAVHRFVVDDIMPQDKFKALSIRKGHKKSIVALAHKVLRTIYAMLSSGTHYQDRSLDYEALSVARNAPRWIKMLRKHGCMAETATA